MRLSKREKVTYKVHLYMIPLVAPRILNIVAFIATLTLMINVIIITCMEALATWEVFPQIVTLEDQIIISQLMFIQVHLIIFQIEFFPSIEVFFLFQTM